MAGTQRMMVGLMAAICGIWAAGCTDPTPVVTQDGAPNHSPAAAPGGAPTDPAATPAVVEPVYPGAVAGPVPEGYKLVWSDEFSKDGPLDTTHWAYEIGFVRNQELQWYQEENAVCKDGLLIIEARKENKPNPRYIPPATDGRAAGRGRGAGGGGGWQNRPTIEYTASSVNTRGKHSWLYGRFEIRARIDIRAGSWPAFWTLGIQGPWPANGEVDIMEYYRGMLLFNVAWGGASGPTWNSVRVQTRDLPAGWEKEFHIWCMDWDEQFIRLYMDDKLINTQDLSRTINVNRGGTGGRGRGNQALENPFHGPAYLLVNQAIGGTNGGDPAGTEFPVRYEVDYVRVYQTDAQVEKTREALAAIAAAAAGRGGGAAPPTPAAPVTPPAGGG